jgi:hypothetical protein
VTSKIGGMPKVFSPRTLGEFEAASASIPIRPLDRAFERAHIRLGKDPGGPPGARRAQFRRYIAGMDQSDPQQRDRLGNALGALIDEVATSKQEFLVKAAERDGFSLVGGVFRPAATAPRSFAVTRVEDLASIEDLGRRLKLLANDDPADAVGGAEELVESVCRTVLNLIGEPAPGKTAGFAAVAKSTLSALDQQQLGAVVAGLGEPRKWKSLSPRDARLAVGAAVTFVAFIGETYVERAASTKRSG